MVLFGDENGGTGRCLGIGHKFIFVLTGLLFSALIGLSFERYKHQTYVSTFNNVSSLAEFTGLLYEILGAPIIMATRMVYIS